MRSERQCLPSDHRRPQAFNLGERDNRTNREIPLIRASKEIVLADFLAHDFLQLFRIEQGKRLVIPIDMANHMARW